MDAYDYIGQYKAGTLSAELKADFELQMAADADLRALVDNYDAIKSASGLLLEEQLLQEVRKVAATADSVSKPDTVLADPVSENAQLGRWFLVGLAVFGFMMGVFYLMKYLTAERPERIPIAQVIDASYKEPLWPVQRGGDLDLLAKGIYQFNQGNRGMASSLLVDSLSDRNMGKYWLAELYFSIRSADSTLLYLPAEQSIPDKSDRIRYLKVLSLVYNNQKEEARQVAQTLPPSYVSRELSDYLDR